MANKTLYIGNLPYSATETSIADHFKKYGATNVRIVEGRGFGFVDVDADQAATAISETNNVEFGSRTLNVNEARPREDRGGGGGGGNRGGGGYGGGGGGGSRGGRW